MFRSGMISGSIMAAVATGLMAVGGCQTHPEPSAVSRQALSVTATSPPLDEQYASAGVVLPASSRTEAVVESAVTSGDVVRWSRRGWSDDQIIDRLDGSGVAFHLNTSDELRLRDAGVSDEVVRAMKASAWK